MIDKLTMLDFGLQVAPDLYNAVFQLDKERGNELATQIRSYLSQKI